MGDIIARIVLCLITLAAIFFLGFFTTIFTLLISGSKFYGGLVITVAAILALYTILLIFNVMRRRLLSLLLGVFFIVSLLTVTGYELNNWYQKKFMTINEQGVDLNEYKPFKKNTKAVYLNEPSTLKLGDDLPILDGATALYPLFSAFAQAVYPEKDYEIRNSEVMCNNTVGAYQNLIDGKVDIIFVAQPSKQQLEEAKRAGVELKLTPIGREAFVFFVNTKNPVNELTTEQIQDIYSGKITNWSEVGGNKANIRAFQRPENSGSQTILQSLMEGKELMTPPTKDVISGMGGIIEETSSYRNYKNAIGYSFLFFATEMIKNNRVKLISVDDIYPNKDTIRSQEYPLAAEFYAVTAGSDNPHIEALLEWILSPQGQFLVDQTGYTSLINEE